MRIAKGYHWMVDEATCFGTHPMETPREVTSPHTVPAGQQKSEPHITALGVGQPRGRHRRAPALTQSRTLKCSHPINMFPSAMMSYDQTLVSKSWRSVPPQIYMLAIASANYSNQYTEHVYISSRQQHELDH